MISYAQEIMKPVYLCINQTNRFKSCVIFNN